jgi:hypothetical protein
VNGTFSKKHHGPQRTRNNDDISSDALSSNLESGPFTGILATERNTFSHNLGSSEGKAGALEITAAADNGGETVGR